MGPYRSPHLSLVIFDKCFLSEKSDQVQSINFLIVLVDSLDNINLKTLFGHSSFNFDIFFLFFLGHINNLQLIHYKKTL